MPSSHLIINFTLLPTMPSPPLSPTAARQKFLQSLDALRSPRTRITKPSSSSITPSRPISSISKRTSPPINAQSGHPPHSDTSDPKSRDFSRYLGDHHPLRLIFIGHNPSEVSWAKAAPYAHRSNRFWPLLEASGMVPAELAQPQHFQRLPHAFGIGFADLFVTSGSDSSKVNIDEGDSLRREVMARLVSGTGNVAPKILCCVSKIVAKKLLSGWKGDYGKAGQGRDWGLNEMGESEIWVLPSTSGRAGLTNAQRLAPFRDLAEYLAQIPWNKGD